MWRSVRYQISILVLWLIVAGTGHWALADRPTSKPMVDPAIALIRDEGLRHSQVDRTLDYLCNVIGQRLTASPSQARASQWTCDTLKQWGLTDAHLEPWGPFGRGWSLEDYSLKLVEPYALTLTGYPKAWSPGVESPLTAEVIYLDARRTADLPRYAGKLKGKVVLIGLVRTTDAHFQPQATRLTGDDLNKLDDAPAGRTKVELLGAASQPASNPATQPGAATRPSVLAQTAAFAFAAEEFSFAAKEGAAVIIDASSRGDGRTVFVAGALVPGPTTRTSAGRAATQRSGSQRTTTAPTTRPKVYAVDAPGIPPQITLATDDFNRLVRMLLQNQQLKVSLTLKVHFYPPSEVSTCNTVAEIPGSDLKDQIVMVGGHLDSWQAGTGATDNGVGAACAMEAIRILRQLNLHPRRTIRVALWTGEEQGLLGSTAYVKEHFGDLPEEPASPRSTRPTTMPAMPPLLHLIKKDEYDRMSVYFNLDNGTGKIRGIYAQGNSAAVPLFRDWLAPFADLEASTVTLANTGSTDHIAFDRIGLPGFQFIQDPIEYTTRTHHSSEDVYDRIQMDDMKQASTIMAGFLWDAANMDQRFPRK